MEREGATIILDWSSWDTKIYTISLLGKNLSMEMAGSRLIRPQKIYSKLSTLNLSWRHSSEMVGFSGTIMGHGIIYPGMFPQ